MKFQIEHNGTTEEIQILDEINFYKLFKYKNDKVYWVVAGEKFDVIIKNKIIKSSGRFGSFDYYKNGKVVEINTDYFDSDKKKYIKYEGKEVAQRIDYYKKENKKTILVAKNRQIESFKEYENEKLKKSTNYFKGKMFSECFYDDNEVITKINYANKMGIHVATITKNGLEIYHRFFEIMYKKGIEELIKIKKICNIDFRLTDWYSMIANQIEKDKKLWNLK